MGGSRGMIGLIVLIGIGLYIWLWIWIAYTAKNRSARVAAIVIGLAIPFLDVPFGYLYFQYQCSSHGGLQLLTTFPPSRAVLLEQGAWYGQEQLFAMGFHTIEYERSGSIVRYVAGMKDSKSIHSAATSPVAIQAVRQKLALNIWRTDTLASRRDDGRALARHTSFSWTTPWWRAEGPLPGGYSSYCFASAESALPRALASGSR